MPCCGVLCRVMSCRVLHRWQDEALCFNDDMQGRETLIYHTVRAVWPPSLRPWLSADRSFCEPSTAGQDLRGESAKLQEMSGCSRFTSGQAHSCLYMCCTMRSRLAVLRNNCVCLQAQQQWHWQPSWLA